MKKSIKRFLVMTQLLGLSALAATACTKNTAETKPTDNTTSKSTTANKETEIDTKSTTEKNKTDATKTSSENEDNNSAKTELNNLTTPPKQLSKDEQDVVQNNLKKVFNNEDLTTLSQNGTLNATHDHISLKEATAINDSDATQTRNEESKVFTDQVLQKIESGEKTQNTNIAQATSLKPIHP